MMNDVIMDFDDFAAGVERDCLHELLVLKDRFPNLKVTLFSVPFWQDKDQKDFLSKVATEYKDWIQLAIHGWDHHDNFECSKWGYNEAYEKISRALDMGCFTYGFKAPGWQISRDTYKALKSLGMWVADHHESLYTEPGVPNSERRPKNLKVYEIDHPWMVHGHTWNCCNNGIYELREKWDKEGYPFDQNTKFHFVSKIAKQI